MSNTTSLSYRIDSELKNRAEMIIYDLGMTPTIAIQMFYKQIIMNHGLPFDAKLQSYPIPVAMSALSDDELNAELMKGYQSIKHDRKYSPDEIDDILEKEFGI